MTAVTRLQTINRELTGEKQKAGDVETNGLYYYLQVAEKNLADFEATLAAAEAKESAEAQAKEDAERAEYGAYITELGEVEGGTGISGFDMGVVDDGFNDYEFSRGAPADGGQTVGALEKALDKIVGDPGVAGKRIKIFQYVSD
jgi:hypothetical protein